MQLIPAIDMYTANTASSALHVSGKTPKPCLGAIFISQMFSAVDKNFVCGALFTGADLPWGGFLSLKFCMKCFM